MDTAILRSRILDLAIHGQLLPQNSADGSVLDLLAAISQSRGQKITPITDGVPFDLPESWCWVNIEMLNQYEADGVNPLKYPSQYFELYSVPNFELKEPEIIKGQDIGSAKQGVMKDDVLLCKINPHLNRVWSVSPKSDYPLIASSEWIVVRNHHCAPQYLVYCFSSGYFKNLMLSNCSGVGGSLTRAQKNYVVKYPFPLPPLAEQRRIVAKVEELLAAVDKIESAQSDIASAASILQSRILDMAIHGSLTKQEPADGSAIKLIASLEEKRSSVLKNKKKLSPIKPIVDNVPFEIPESWCWVRLDDLGLYRKGPFGSSLTKSMFVPEGPDTYKVYEQKNAIQKDASLGHYFITKEKFESMQSFIVQPDDIIISCAGTIGETYVIPENAKPGIINQALMRVKLYDKSITNFWLLYFESVLQEESRKQGKGTAMKNIPPFDIFKQMPFPLPPLAEQRRIVAKVESLFAAIDKLK